MKTTSETVPRSALTPRVIGCRVYITLTDPVHAAIAVAMNMREILVATNTCIVGVFV